MSKRRLRLWIRLLRVTRVTEAQLREFLRVEHGSTLPRFDVMAALHRSDDDLTMTELSRRLLVSNGNTTTVVDRLELDGLVTRTTSAADRRVVHVALTDEGRRHFDRLAAEHEAQVNSLFVGRVLGRSRCARGDSATTHRHERRRSMTSMAELKPQHFLWQVEDGIATVRLDRPERKNPLTFDSYAELRDTFREPRATPTTSTWWCSPPNGGNFCSGGDVHEIIGPLVGHGHEASCWPSRA